MGEPALVFPGVVVDDLVQDAARCPPERRTRYQGFDPGESEAEGRHEC